MFAGSLRIPTLSLIALIALFVAWSSGMTALAGEHRQSAKSVEAMTDESKVEAVKGIIATLFSAQRSLKALAPDFNWSGLGNLLGDFGEFIAIEHYQLTKASPGSDGFDALTKDGKTVQIKANHAASQIGFRGTADLMLVIYVGDDGEWEELYFGDFDKVKTASRYSARDNKHMIAISKLKQLRDD